jgi:hypothetical protein
MSYFIKHSIIFLLVLLSVFFSAQAQGQGINNRFHFEYPATVFHSLVATDSASYISGLVADTAYANQSANIMVKIDEEGDPEWIRLLNSPHQTYETWSGSLIDLEGDGFIINGYSFDTTTLAGSLFRYDALGNFLWERKIYNSFGTDEFIRTAGLAQLNDDFLVLLRELNPSSPLNEDIGLVKVNATGEDIWRRSYQLSDWEEFATSIAVINENTYWVGGGQNNANLTSQNKKYRTIVFKVDTFGNKTFQWTSPENELWDAANAIVPSGDGGGVIASGKGVEIFVNPGLDLVVWTNPTIFKLNSSLQLEWETNFNLSNAPFYFNQLSDIVKVSDGSGYVATGQFAESYTNEDGTLFAADLHGWVIKVSPEGDSLWTRKLHFLPEIGRFQHYLYDMAETPDGGFILCGQVLDETLIEHYQQAWLVKVDEHGCLVPGCHTPTSTTSPPEVQMDLLLYPNPVREELNVFLRDNRNNQRQDRWLRVLNMNGQQLRHYDIGQSLETSFIISVQSLLSGSYVLQYGIGNSVVRSEVFVKA